jgi:CobW/HypB/UreG, nucleotide-binding domain
MDSTGVPSDNRPVLVLLGGFLGAGKTTLILTASRLLQARGLRVAVILNDQGSELVDTRYVQGSGVPADQVTGGCFCCRFSDLIDAADRLNAYAPAVIFAEAVGSCADISATTLQPLKLHYAAKFRLAPYSVLIDPDRLREFQAPGADSDLAFLFRKQLDEADLICFTKSDLHSTFPELPGSPVRYLSPLTGEGVAAWLDETLVGHLRPGGKILEIDYARYARAEAKLAWLNCNFNFVPAEQQSPALVIGPLLDTLDAALTAAGLQIAHLKLFDESSSGHLKASIVRNGAEPSVEGMLAASPAARHELLLNIRAAGEPSALRRLVEGELAKLPGEVRVRSMQCFSPAAPNVEHRLSSVV